MALKNSVKGKRVGYFSGNTCGFLVEIRVFSGVTCGVCSGNTSDAFVSLMSLSRASLYCGGQKYR